MGRAIQMENDIDKLKMSVSNIEKNLESINKELEGLAKLQEIAVNASKPKPKPKSTKKGE